MRTLALLNRLVLLAASLAASTYPCSAQGSPIPADFSAAQTAFLASAGAPALGTKERLVVSMLYTSLYQQLQSWQRYKLVATPRTADLTFEVSIDVAFSDVTNGSSLRSPYIRLCIRDVKTGALLWTLDEPVSGAFRKKTFQRNIDDTVAVLLEDLKALAKGEMPSA